MGALVGISARNVNDEVWCPPLTGARKGYIDAIVEAGGIPVVLPPVEDMALLRAMYERMDAIMITGGVDVDPKYYGEEPHVDLGSVHPERDIAELPLARWAIAEGKPIFGICRGHQVINVALGGTLYQDLPAQKGGPIDHEISVKHECWERLDHGLTLSEDSLLAEMLGASQLDVNSLHHQAIKDLAPGLRATGLAPDGVVEAVEGLGRGFVLGVQSHPEMLWQQTDLRWRNVFRAFVRAGERAR